MVEHLILILLNLICLIPFYIFRKKIKYLFCPEEIFSRTMKRRTFLVFNVFPSLALGIASIIHSRIYFESKPFLVPYANYSLLIGILSLLLSMGITGFLVDKVLYFSDLKYRFWRNTGIILEMDDRKEGDFL